MIWLGSVYVWQDNNTPTFPLPPTWLKSQIHSTNVIQKNIYLSTLLYCMYFWDFFDFTNITYDHLIKYDALLKIKGSAMK